MNHPVTTHTWAYPLPGSLSEDRIWDRDLFPHLAHLSSAALNIWFDGSQKMINNALEHSQGDTLTLTLTLHPTQTELTVEDN